MFTLQEKVNRLSVIGIEWMGPDEKYMIGESYQDLPDIEPMTDDQFDAFCNEVAAAVPTIIDRSMTVIKKGSEILRGHEQRSSRALGIGRKLIGRWDAAYAITDPEERFKALADADTRSKNFLVNCRDALKEMKEGRAALSQLMDKIKALFTAEENVLDPATKDGTIPKLIQGKRDQYVKDQLAYQEQVRKLAEKRQKKEKEAVDLKVFIQGAIGKAMIDYQARIKASWLKSFNEITLDNYDAKAAGLESIRPLFPSAKVEEICQPAKQLPVYHQHTTEEVEAIFIGVWDTYDFSTFFISYGQDMQDYKKELQDKLPSKKEELLEAKRIADKAEADRLAEVERQKEAEKQREEKLKQQKSEQAKQQELQRQENERKAEKDRLDKIEADRLAEQTRLENDRKLREQEEQNRLLQEQQTATQQLETKTEVTRTAGHAASLFSQTLESSTLDTPAARTGFEIEVLNKAGWVEIFTMWFEREGKDLALDKWGTKTLNAMKKELEAIATKAAKEGKTDQISSKNLLYNKTAKATNLREKEDKK